MRIFFFNVQNWDKKASDFIFKTYIKKRKKINLILTGGSSAKKFTSFYYPVF